MTLIEKLKEVYPNIVIDVTETARRKCPTFIFENVPDCVGDCEHNNGCEACWNQKYEKHMRLKYVKTTELNEIKIKSDALAEGLIAGIELPNGPSKENVEKIIEALPDNPSTILDSGDRTEFETGAVRDMREGKGRCDLMPLDVVGRFYDHLKTKQLVVTNGRSEVGSVFICISRFQNDGNVSWLYEALRWAKVFGDNNWETMFLEVAKHFEEGCKKYGEDNWRKGIPVKCYIDSAVRHYLKFLRGDKDEPHDRAFVWNILCCIWTSNRESSI